VKLQLGYATAMFGYMVAIFAVGTPSRDGGVWSALAAAAIEVPLFVGLAACMLLCLTDGEWRRKVSWPLYALVVAVSGGYAAVGEWYAAASGRAASLADFLVSVAGVIGLLVVHWVARRQWMV